MGLAGQIADILTALLLSLFGLALVFLLLVYWRDRHQSRNAIYRNYPLIGHMRYLLQELGVFLRTYFFAADREELPFNRFQREFINDMADDHDGVVAFGSDYQLHADGAVRFANSFYPVLEEDVLHVKKVTFGPDTASLHHGQLSQYFRHVLWRAVIQCSAGLVARRQNGRRLAQYGRGRFFPLSRRRRRRHGVSNRHRQLWCARCGRQFGL